MLYRSLLVGLCVAAAAAAPAQAQRRARRGLRPVNPYRTTVGLHLGYNTDLDDALLGAQATVPFTAGVALYPSFDYYFASVGSLWALNVDLKFRSRRPLYAGAGYDYQHASVNGRGSGESHLGVFAGVEGRGWRARPYLEARVLLGNNTQFQAAFGLSW